MKRCEKCGAVIPDEAIFCPECGFKNQPIQVKKTVKKKSKKPWIIVLCLICIVIAAVFLINKFMRNGSDDKNGVKNDRSVIYDNTIYFIKNRTLYKANEDGAKQKVLKKLPHELMGDGGDGYDNLMVYKDRLYAIRWTDYSLDSEYYIFSIALDGTDYKKEVTLPRIEGSEGEQYTGNIRGFSIVDNYIYFTYCLYDDTADDNYCTVYKQKIGTTKYAQTKYEGQEEAELSGKYAYYVKSNEDSETSELIRMDVETGKEAEYYSGQSINTGFGNMAISKQRLIFSKNPDILWMNLKDKKDFVERKVTPDTEEDVAILNANEKEVFYKADGSIYKMNLDTQESQELISTQDIQNNMGVEIKKVELLGETMAIYGYLDEYESNEFIIFIQKKEGMSYEDYESLIQNKIKQCKKGM